MQSLKIKDLENFSSTEQSKDIGSIINSLSNDDESSDSSSDNKSIHQTDIIIKTKNGNEWIIKQPTQNEIQADEHINEVTSADILRIFNELTPKTRIAKHPNNQNIYILSKKLPGFTLEKFLETKKIEGYNEEFIKLHILNAILGNIDAHRNNFIINDEQKRLISIDGGRSFNILKTLNDDSSFLCRLFNKGCILRGSVGLDDIFKAIPSVMDYFITKSSEINIRIQQTSAEIADIVGEDFVDKKLKVIKANIEYINKVTEIYQLPLISKIRNNDINEEILEEFRNLNIEDKKIAINILRSLLSEKFLSKCQCIEYQAFENKINTLIIHQFQEKNFTEIHLKDLECFFLADDKEEFIKKIREDKSKALREKIEVNCAILGKIKNILDRSTLNNRAKTNFESFNSELQQVILQELERLHLTDKIDFLRPNSTFVQIAQNSQSEEISY